MCPHELDPDWDIDKINLSHSIKTKLKEDGITNLGQLDGTWFPNLFEVLSFGQAKDVLKELLSRGISVTFSEPAWTDEEWHQFVERMVQDGLVTWQEVGVTMCGAMNPPQVGTAIASNKSFQAKFPPRQTMQNVMAWFYSQGGVCAECGTRLSLEADHIRSKQEYFESGEDPGEADRLENLQLLCKRCNVIKRPSHTLGGISFAPAQSVLIWILLTHKPRTRGEFYQLCREYGLTMASVRFDEAWAFAVWLKKQGKYDHD